MGEGHLGARDPAGGPAGIHRYGGFPTHRLQSVRLPPGVEHPFMLLA